MPTNTVVLVGRLTRAPELSYTSNDKAVAQMRLAVPRLPVDGVEQPANYLTVTVWGQQAERCDQYLITGQRVAITGELRYREWTNTDGEKRNAVEVVAHTVEFLDKPGGRDQAPAEPHAASSTFTPVPAGAEIPA